jgi:hypothetical protein
MKVTTKLVLIGLINSAIAQLPLQVSFFVLIILSNSDEQKSKASKMVSR